jgi:hypothetical protein
LGAPGEVAVTATARAHEHIALLAGEGTTSLWRNEVAPRGLFGMLRYRPGDVAHRLAMPVLVCIADDDQETPEESTRLIAQRAPRGGCAATRARTSTSTGIPCAGRSWPTRSFSCGRTSWSGRGAAPRR